MIYIYMIYIHMIYIHMIYIHMIYIYIYIYIYISFPERSGGANRDPPQPKNHLCYCLLVKKPAPGTPPFWLTAATPHS